MLIFIYSARRRLFKLFNCHCTSSSWTSLSFPCSSSLSFTCSSSTFATTNTSNHKFFRRKQAIFICSTGLQWKFNFCWPEICQQSNLQQRWLYDRSWRTFSQWVSFSLFPSANADPSTAVSPSSWGVSFHPCASWLLASCPSIYTWTCALRTTSHTTNTANPPLTRSNCGSKRTEGVNHRSRISKHATIW